MNARQEVEDFWPNVLLDEKVVVLEHLDHAIDEVERYIPEVSRKWS